MSKRRRELRDERRAARRQAHGHGCDPHRAGEEARRRFLEAMGDRPDDGEKTVGVSIDGRGSWSPFARGGEMHQALKAVQPDAWNVVLPQHCHGCAERATGRLLPALGAHLLLYALNLDIKGAARPALYLPLPKSGVTAEELFRQFVRGVEPTREHLGAIEKNRWFIVAGFEITPGLEQEFCKVYAAALNAFFGYE